MMPHAINALVDVMFLAFGSLSAQINTGNILGAAVSTIEKAYLQDLSRSVNLADDTYQSALLWNLTITLAKSFGVPRTLG